MCDIGSGQGLQVTGYRNTARGEEWWARATGDKERG